MATNRMTLKEMFNVSGVILILLWGVLLASFLLENVFKIELNHLGIHPRTLWGLTGIPFAPFLHANIWHLLSNMSALMILGVVLMLLEGRRALGIVLLIVFLGGLGTWLVGREASHVGASGVVFGLMGYLMASGLFRRNVLYITVSLLVLFFYGGALWGMLPLMPGVSFEGHICGFLAGVVAASLSAPNGEKCV